MQPGPYPRISYHGLLKRDVSADATSMRCVGDGTHLPLVNGTNHCLATVIYCYSGAVLAGRWPARCEPEMVEDG